MSLFLYFAAAFGLAFIVGHSYITRPVREVLVLRAPTLVILLECPACFGTWVGTFVGLIAPGLFGFDGVWDQRLLAGVTAGCATAGVNYALAVWTRIIPTQVDLQSLANDDSQVQALREQALTSLNKLVEPKEKKP